MQKEISHIIEMHQAKIYKTCLGFTGDIETAKDLVQEVCINLWLGFDKFRADANISTWVYRVTLNTCLMHKRKKRLNTVNLVSYKEEVEDKPTDNINDDLKLLQQFIIELPEKERIIIILYLENLAYEEIAQIVGISTNYIGVKINRIKKILTKKFECVTN